MSEGTHSNTATIWLAFFFVCFAIAIFGIGLWACFCYKVDDATAPPAGGGHSMRLPADSDHAVPFDLAPIA